MFSDSINSQKDISRIMSEFREILENENIVDEFGRVVFESIIEKIYVGGYNEDGTPDLTFILKGNQMGIVSDVKVAYKEKQKEV